MPPRVPTQADFDSLSSTLPVELHFPDPPESTTAFLILFHGLGDHEVPFAGFAKNLNLPGVLGISVRGTSPLPPSLLGLEPEEAVGLKHFHFGDDLKLNHATGDIDEDPGFEKSSRLVREELIRGVLVDKCGWEMSDIMFFGFGQGGSLALGLASQLRSPTARVEDITDGETPALGKAFKGVVSVGGPLPPSMVSTSSAREKSATSVLVSQLDDEQVEYLQGEFKDVRTVKWGRGDVRMPGNQEEVLPLMKFFAERLKDGFQFGG